MKLLRSIQTLVPLLVAATLAGCGGGGGGSAGEGGKPSVTNLSASTVQFGRKMTVTVQGFELASNAISLEVDNGCEEITTEAGGTETLQQFSCKVVNLGAHKARVRNAEGREIASLSLFVPNPQVTMRLSQGSKTFSFVIELDPGAARSTVRNFLDHVNAGFYTNTLAHRLEPDVMLQGGTYNNNAQRTNKPAPFAPIKLQADNGLKNLKHTIAMFHGAEPDSATSEFFINLKDNPQFDFGTHPQGYTVFGKVVSGTEVLEEINKLPGRTVPLEEPFAFLPDPVLVNALFLQTR